MRLKVRGVAERSVRAKLAARNQAGIVGLAVIVLLPSACATGPGERRSIARQSEPTLAPGVDPVKARMALAQIEPAPSKPVRPESLKPVSQRAADQIRKARGLIAEQRYTEAAIELERALRYDPNHPDLHRTLALLHWEAGNLERAKTHAQRAIQTNPDDAGAQYVLGRCQAAAGDKAAALSAYRTALLCSDVERDPKTAGLVRFHLAEALMAEGYLTAALEQFESFRRTAEAMEEDAVFRAERAASQQARATALEQLGRFGEAADALAGLAAAADANDEMRLRYARLLLRAGRLAEARQAALALPLDRDESVDLLFEIHQASGKPEQMIEDLASRTAESPDNARLVLRLTEAMSRLDRSRDARKELERFLDRHPDAADVRLALVDVLVRLAEWDDALRVAAEGVEQHADRSEEFRSKLSALASNEAAVRALLETKGADASAAVLFLQGAVAQSAGRAEESERLLRAAYAKRAEFVAPRVALAQLLIDQFRYDEALAVAQRREVDTPEDLELELRLGEVFDRLDDIRNAELHYNAAIQLDRADTRALFDLAQLYARGDQRLRAQRQLQVLLEKDPNHENARELLAYTYLADSKLDVAIQQMEELSKRAKSPLVKLRCEGFLSQARQPDREAYRRELLDGMEEFGEDSTTWLAIAQSYSDDSDLERRREAFRRALELDGGNEEAALGVVETSRRLLDFEGAIRQMETLLKRRPNRDAWRLGYVDRRGGRAEFWPGLIELYWIVHNHDAALATAESAAKTTEDEAQRKRYRQAIVETLRFAHRTDDAIARLKELMAAEPEEPGWPLYLADLYIRADRPAEAVPVLAKIFETGGRFGELANLLQALVDAGQHVRATQYLLDWLHNDPESDEALSRLAIIEADAGRVEDALELVRNRLLRTLNREHFQNVLISLLAQADRYAEAADLVVRLMDTVISLGRAGQGQEEAVLDHRPSDDELIHLPNEPYTADRLEGRLMDLRSKQVTVDLAGKEYRTAEQRLTEWLENARDPRERYGYLVQLSAAYRLMGDEAKAGDALTRALLLRPDDIAINNDVAYSWIDRGERLDEAERMIRLSVSRAPRQSAYLDTYGWLLYKKGSFAEAAKWIERARHGRATPDPVILDHLGDVYWRLGKQAEAIELWEAGVAAGHEAKEGEQISDDEKRVAREAPSKIEAARAGREPAVAPLAKGPKDEAATDGAH